MIGIRGDLRLTNVRFLYGTSLLFHFETLFWIFPLFPVSYIFGVDYYVCKNVTEKKIN